MTPDLMEVSAVTWWMWLLAWPFTAVMLGLTLGLAVGWVQRRIVRRALDGERAARRLGEQAALHDFETFRRAVRAGQEAAALRRAAEQAERDVLAAAEQVLDEALAAAGIDTTTDDTQRGEPDHG